MAIRDATTDDAGCAAIYAPYVADTAITFEVEPPAADEMARRIAAAQRAHAWLVAADGDRIVGYAYAGPFSARAAYAWSCESSIYLERGRRRTGAGRTLYDALFAGSAASGTAASEPDDAAQSGEPGPARGARLRDRRRVPRDRLEARRLARRGLGTAPPLSRL